MSSEHRILDAICAHKGKQYNSIRKSVRTYSISESTLRLPISGGISRSTAHKSDGQLSPAKKQIRMKWISTLTKYTAAPFRPLLLENSHLKSAALCPRLQRRALPPLPLLHDLAKAGLKSYQLNILK